MRGWIACLLLLVTACEGSGDELDGEPHCACTPGTWIAPTPLESGSLKIGDVIMDCDGAELWDEGRLEAMDGACMELSGITDDGLDVHVHAIGAASMRMEWDVTVDGEDVGHVEFLPREDT